MRGGGCLYGIQAKTASMAGLMAISRRRNRHMLSSFNQYFDAWLSHDKLLANCWGII
jgi:hypothetical protein